MAKKRKVYKIDNWAPGNYDLDCSKAAEVCCYDGCVNVCRPPMFCHTTYEPKTENVTKEMCNLVAQPPKCVTVTQDVCDDVTETVEDVVTTNVEENVCDVITEQVSIELSSLILS